MKKTLLSLFIIATTFTLTFAQKTEWKIDHAHSMIGFKATHMVISKVEGEFEEYSGTILADKPDFTDAEISLTIQVASINTGIEKRDHHLRSDDFFNAEEYPTMTFKSKSFKKVNDDHYKLTGDLTIRDHTHEIVLDVTYGGTIKDPYGNTRAGFALSGTLNRFDYGLKWDNMIETGGLVVGKEIDLNISVELIKQ